MRIIAGKLKGTSLYPSENKSTRPLRDMARENVFNLLIHSKKILFDFERSNVLDLYAGTGSFGLECLSRLAENVYFVEKEKKIVQILKKNIEKLKLNTKTNILIDDVIKVLNKDNFYKLKFDLIFCDPPFKNSNILELIELIFKRKLLKKDGIVILHRNKNSNDKFPNYFEIVDMRIYGISKIIFGKF